MLIDYRTLKSAGVYTFEYDNTQMPIVQTSALRLLVGWNPTGPFNVPVFINSDKDRRAFFGDIDPKYENKGAYLNRSTKTALQAGPVFALNLMHLDKQDKTGYTVLSLDSSEPNPSQIASVDGKTAKYLPSTNYLHDNNGDFVGITSFVDLYDRSRFWNPSPDNIIKHFRSDDGSISDSTENRPLLGFANTGTKDVSILVYKPGQLRGYDVTVREWYGGEESIPYPWLRPTDYISDYFVQVVAIQGLWSDFKSYAADPYWSEFFTEKGIKFDKLNDFIMANSITRIGSWIGCIIPDFEDATGAPDYIVDKINNSSLITGITCALNKDALNAIELNLENNEKGGNAKRVFTNPNLCIEDIDGLGSRPAPYQIDMVGHNLTDKSSNRRNKLSFLSYNVEKNYLIEDNKENTGLPIGCAELNNVKYFGNYNTLLVPPQDSDDVNKLKVDAIDNTFNKTFKEQLNILASKEANALDSSYLSLDLFKGTKTNNEVLKQFTSDKLSTHISLALTKAKAESRNRDAIANLLAGYTAGRSYNAFFDLSETGFMHNMSSSSNQFVGEDDSRLGAVRDMAYKNLIPGLSHISNIQTVDFDGLVSLNNSNDNRLSEDELNKLKALYGVNAEFKIVTCVDPILTEKESASALTYGAGKSTPNVSAIATAKIEEIFNNEGIDTYFKDLEVGVKDKIREKKTTKLDKSDLNKIANILKTIIANLLVDAEFVDSLKNASDLKNTLKEIYLWHNVDVNKLRNTDKPANNKETEDNSTCDVNGGTCKGTPSNPNEEADGSEKCKPGENCETEDKPIEKGLSLKAYFQYPINSTETSSVLRFIPIKGLELKPRHLPGFDKKGCRDFEAGVDKIYEMLMDPGIFRGLVNPDMINFRYIVDTMGGGLRPNLGGKVYLSRLAKARGKCTALLNAPSITSFAASSNPYFCDVYNQGTEAKPPFDSKYVPLGGNKKMIASNSFSLMSEADGATYAGVFTPYLKYVDGNKTVLMPPAADVSNTFMRKFNGGDPYAIVANTKGVLSGSNLAGVEVMLDKYDRDQFEPYGLNSIIQRNNQIMIYSNRTPYQRVRSDFNFLHVRELLNTIEIEIEAVLQNFVFEYNNAITRSAIITLVNPILSTMRDAGALYNYELEFNETPDDSVMIGDEVAVLSVGVVINKGMEKIVQVISVNKRGKVKLVR